MGSGAVLPWEIFLIFTPLSPYPGFPSHLDRISTWKVFFIIKNIFIMKNVTNFSKMVETGVYPHVKRRICLQDDEHTESLKIES